MQSLKIVKSQKAAVFFAGGHIPFLLSFLIASTASATSDTLGLGFFSGLTDSLITEYHHCTKDTSRSMRDILIWKKKIDAFSSSTDYPEILKSFLKETGLNPQDISPCDILQWKIEHDRRVEEIEKTLADQEIKNARERAESLFVENELKNVTSSKFDIFGIPFGITKKCFTLLTAKKELSALDDQGNYLILDSLRLGKKTFKAAFFLDTDGKYCRYELESSPLPLDSLDGAVRKEVEYLSTYLETIAGKAPDHLYRVGRFEIVQGRLALHSLWTLDNIKIYTGFSSFKYRYYAKAIVTEY